MKLLKLGLDDVMRWTPYYQYFAVLCFTSPFQFTCSPKRCRSHATGYHQTPSDTIRGLDDLRVHETMRAPRSQRTAAIVPEPWMAQGLVRCQAVTWPYLAAHKVDTQMAIQMTSLIMFELKFDPVTSIYNSQLFTTYINNLQ